MAYLQPNELQAFQQFQREMNMPAPQPTKRGFLGNLAMGITEPFRRVGQDVLRSGQLAIAPRSQESPLLLTREELAARRAEDPLFAALKSGVGVGAFAVPGGGTLPQALGRGALAGGGFGFAQAQRPEEALESTLGGALFGAGTGGAMFGAGKLLGGIGKRAGALGEKGEIVEAKGMGLKPKPKEAMAIQKMAKTGQAARNITEQYGEKATASGIGKTQGKIFNQVDEALKGVKGGYSVDDVVGQLKPEVAAMTGSGDDAAEILIRKFIKQSTGQESGTLSYQQLANAKKMFQKVAYSTSDSTPAVTKRAIHDMVDDLLKTDVPAIEPLYNNLRQLYVGGEDIVKQSMKPRKMGVGWLKVPGFGVPEAAQRTLGRTEQAVGRLAGGIPKMAVPSIGSRLAPIAGAAIGTQQPQEIPAMPTEGMGYETPTAEVAPAMEEATGLGMPPQDFGQILALGVLSGEIDATQAKAVADLMGLGTGGGGKMLPSGAASTLNEVENAMGQLDDLQASFEATRDVYGPIKGKIRGINPWDVKGQGAKQMIMMVKQIIGKGLEGGVLRKEDEYKYEQILPKLGDRPETVQLKIDQLRQALESKYSSSIEGFQARGYDPFAGRTSNIAEDYYAE